MREEHVGKLGALSAEFFSSLRLLAPAGCCISFIKKSSWAQCEASCSQSVGGRRDKAISPPCSAFGLHRACWREQPHTSLSLPLRPRLPPSSLSFLLPSHYLPPPPPTHRVYIAGFFTPHCLFILLFFFNIFIRV